MLAAQPVVIYVVEDVDIVDEDGFVVVEQRGSLLQRTAGFQQLLSLVADEDAHAVAVLVLHVLFNLVGQMVHVYHEALVALLAQS